MKFLSMIPYKYNPHTVIVKLRDSIRRSKGSKVIGTLEALSEGVGNLVYKGHCNSCRKEVEFEEGEPGDTKGSKGKKRTFIMGTCPECGSKVLDWQSKYNKRDKPPKAQPLAVLEPEPDAESSPPEESPEIIPSLEGDSGEVISEEPEQPEEVEIIPPEDVQVENPEDAPGTPKEEETDWTEYLPIIIIVIGLIIAIVGIWWTSAKTDEKKKDEKKEKGD